MLLHTLAKYVSVAVIWFIGVTTVAGILSLFGSPGWLINILCFAYGWWFACEVWPRYLSWFDRSISR